MIIIRQQQMDAFDRASHLAFENEMVLHSKDFSPQLCDVIGEEQLRVALRQAMSRARSYGFTYRGSMRLYIELMFLCGSDFDTDPQYPMLTEILHSSTDQMLRAEQIYEGVLDYLERVSGPDAVNERAAYRALLAFAQKPLDFSSSEFVTEMLRELTGIYPLKANYVGEKGLKGLIHKGIDKAQEFGFATVLGKRLLVTLMFGFGHGCLDDPIYPWIARTLRDERIVDPSARARRLEKKAVTWLEHVLMTHREGR